MLTLFVRFEDILENCISAIQEQGRTVEDCLDRYPAYRGELEPLLRLAVRLPAARALQAPPEFRRAAMTRMNNMVAARPRRAVVARRSRSIGLTWQRVMRTWQRLPVAIMAGICIILVVAGGGVVSASTSALPGDALYPVKTVIEAAELSMSQDDVTGARLHLAFASRRLNEANALLQSNRIQDVERALMDYAAQLQPVLALLGEGSTLPARDQADLASVLLAEVDRQTAQIAVLVDRTGADPAGPALRVVHDARERALVVIGAGPGPVPLEATATPTESPAPTATGTPAPVPQTTVPSPTEAVPSPTSDLPERPRLPRWTITPEPPTWPTPPVVKTPVLPPILSSPNRLLTPRVPTLVPPKIVTPRIVPTPGHWSTPRLPPNVPVPKRTRLP